MEQTSIGITLFGVIFVGLIVITIGLGGLKLLSLLVNALLGRRTPQQATKVGAWSGVVTALAVTATVFVGLVMVALLFLGGVQLVVLGIHWGLCNRLILIRQVIPNIGVTLCNFLRS